MARRRGGGMSTTVDETRDGPVVAERPAPGAPRRYEFPPVTRRQLPNGLSILIVDLPGRPLVSASMVVVGGAAEEPADQAGATVLAARALTEGTERYEAIALVEASERLGASLHAESGWDTLSVSVDVPSDRLAAALDLVAEVLLHPTFPGAGGRTAARRAAQRPAPGPGRSAPTRRGGVRRDDLRLELALSPAVGRDARDRRGPDRGRAPRGLPARCSIRRGRR